jgi:hypothetical protein
VPLYRLYVPDKGFWDKVGDFFSGVAGAIAGAASTIGGAIFDTFDSTVGWVLDGVSWVLENTIFMIPGLRDLWNFVLTLFWGILSIFDFLLNLLGIRPEKRMRIMVIEQEGEEGQLVANADEILPLLQIAMDLFKDQANVRLLPVGAFRYSSPFQDAPTASNDYIYAEQTPGRGETLDVNCDTDLFVDDLGAIGRQFNFKLSNDLFFAGWRRLIGYGAPVGVFAVRSFKNGHSRGCSLWGLADWVVVQFRSPDGAPPLDGRVLPHELGHACNLTHPPFGRDPNNLMTPGEDGGVGYELSTLQIAFLRASRHVTYF